MFPAPARPDEHFVRTWGLTATAASSQPGDTRHQGRSGRVSTASLGSLRQRILRAPARIAQRSGQGETRVDLYEYQAKELFAAHGVPVLPGRTVETPEEAAAAAGELGTTVVVKAQVKTGGRGKAGGVKLAASPEEAREKAAAILGLDIKGHTVHQVLVTEASDISEEYYFSFLLDRSN